jgi:ribulose-phosphate 3-epimerase
LNELLHSLQITPSILSADFSRLGEEVSTVMDAGALVIHVDVMDGHFVPNITIGPPVVAAIAPQVHERGGLLDVHLMIEQPERYIEAFVKAGADGLTVHQETCRHLHSTLAQIRAAGAWAGISLNPATPVETLAQARAYCDLVLIMSVNPGFGGQSFIPESVGKLRQAREYLPEAVAVQIDGGVTVANARELVAAGANLLVAGSSVFGGDPAARFRELSAAAAG